VEARRVDHPLDAGRAGLADVEAYVADVAMRGAPHGVEERVGLADRLLRLSDQSLLDFFREVFFAIVARCSHAR